MTDNSPALLDNHTTVELIRRFLASDKPANITPLDILQMTQFMICKAEDHDIFYSQQTLARMFKVDTRSIARSQQRLASPEIDWIARPQRRGKPNAVSLKYQNIPAEEILRLKITPDAEHLAVRYQQRLQKLGRKKFPAQWLRQQFPSAQRIINQCGGNLELAKEMVGYALYDPRHTKKAKQGLYHLFGRWREIKSAYTAWKQQRQSISPETAQTEVA